MIERVKAWWFEGTWMPWAVLLALMGAVLYLGQMKQQIADLQEMRAQFAAEHGAIVHELSDIKAYEAAEVEKQKAQDSRLDLLEKRR